MPIKAKCRSCGTGFKAKDSLAGKRVKCPKCKEPLTIPAAEGARPTATAARAASSAAPSTPAFNPMLDLLDEANVRSAVRGPTCENCAAELRAGAVLCIECGFNMETGKRLATEVEEDGGSDRGKTDAERLMSKAEKDIEDMPVTADGQDFGDGADSLVIAGVAGLILLLLVGIGLTVIFSMEYITQWTNSGAISFVASLGMILGCGGWITYVAFKLRNSIHGIVCICTAGLWCIVFGFMQGKDLLIPTVILLFSFVVAAVAGTYVFGYHGFGPIETDL